MRKLKILQCPIFYLPNRVGGIEVYVHALSRQLLGMGHDVKVLVADYPGEAAHGERYDGVPVMTYPGFFNETRKEFKGLAPGRGLAGFISALEKESPDIVHFHQITNSNGISLFHIEAAKKLGIRVVYTNHLAGLTCYTGKMMYRGKEACDGIINESKCGRCELERHHIGEGLARMIVGVGHLSTKIVPKITEMDGKVFSFLSYYDLIRQKKATAEKVLDMVDAFIVLADWYHAVLGANGLLNPKVRIIRQGLPSPGNSVPEKASSDGVLKLVFIGRIFPEKGLLVLLKALKDIDEGKVTLDIYGQQDDVAYVEACRALSEGKNNINWHSFIDNKAIISMMSNYDALVLPSVVAEMAPLVIQEAFAGGIMVIGSAIGGIKDEIVHGKNGYLFEMGNDDQLKAIIQRLTDAPSERDKLVISAPRSFESVAAATEEAYYSVIN
jgi:glycosyltransferase involved in cell wall biosynthesis